MRDEASLGTLPPVGFDAEIQSLACRAAAPPGGDSGPYILPAV
jgi:hypothetical protein